MTPSVFTQPEGEESQGRKGRLLGKGHIPEDTFVYARVYVHMCVGAGVRARVCTQSIMWFRFQHVCLIPFFFFFFKCTMSVHAPAFFSSLKFSCVCMLVCLCTVVSACINAQNVNVTSVRKHPQPPQAPLSIDKTQTLFSSRAQPVSLVWAVLLSFHPIPAILRSCVRARVCMCVCVSQWVSAVLGD